MLFLLNVFAALKGTHFYILFVADLEDRVSREAANIPSKKSSAHLRFPMNSVLARNGRIKCHISLFKEIILQQLDEFKNEIKGYFTILSAFKVFRGHPSKVAI